MHLFRRRSSTLEAPKQAVHRSPRGTTHVQRFFLLNLSHSWAIHEEQAVLAVAKPLNQLPTVEEVTLEEGGRRQMRFP